MPHRLMLAALCLLVLTVTVRVTGTILPESADTPLQAAMQQPTPSPAPTQQPAGYAGSDTCVICHFDQEATLKGSAHAQAKNPRSPAASRGCESRHGPGQAYVDDEAKTGSGRSCRRPTSTRSSGTCRA